MTPEKGHQNFPSQQNLVTVQNKSFMLTIREWSHKKTANQSWHCFSLILHRNKLNSASWGKFNLKISRTQAGLITVSGSSFLFPTLVWPWENNHGRVPWKRRELNHVLLLEPRISYKRNKHSGRICRKARIRSSMYFVINSKKSPRGVWSISILCIEGIQDVPSKCHKACPDYDDQMVFTGT
jgi:hypothetical protein